MVLQNRVLWLCFLLVAVEGVPKFTTPNQKDRLTGKACPAPIVPVACAPMCVSDYNDCPLGFGAASCTNGESLCADGACHPTGTNCSNAGPDLCGCSTDSNRLSCQVATGSASSDADTTTICAGLYNLTVGNFTRYELDCELPTNDVTLASVFALPGMTVIFVGLGVFALLNIFWWLYKTRAEKAFAAEKELEQRALNKPDLGSGIIVFKRGYNDHIVGTLIFDYLVLISLAWQVMFVVVVCDYYELFTPMIMGTYSNLHAVLIVVFHFSVIWYIVVILLADPLRNWFRIRAPYGECSMIQVWQYEPTQVFLAAEDTVSRIFQRIEEIKAQLFGVTGVYSTIAVQITANGTRYYDFQCVRHTFFPEDHCYQSHTVELPTDNASLKKLVDGLSSATAKERLELMGPNFIRVQVDNFLVALGKEFFTVFYLYQISMLWVYFYWSYWQMGTVALIVVGGAGLMKAVIKRNSELKIKSMAEYISVCQVLRDGEWQTLETSALIPGDVFEVLAGLTVPCDAALVSGSCVNDESMLTGEAMPIQKFTLPSEGTYDKAGHSKKQSIFAGTKILQTQLADGADKVRALVIHSGSYSEKGELVSGLLFKTKITFVFDQHLILVFMILFAWSLPVFSLVIWLNDAAGPGSWLTGIFCLAQILSPVLPAVLVIGQSVAGNRLKQKDIFCVDLARITISGKIKMFCFDKTGTLTKEGLEFYGVHVVESDAEQATFGKVIEKVDELPRTANMALGCSHTISQLGNLMVGNPVDVEMFRTSKWQLTQKDTGDELVKGDSKLRILRRFEFDHHRMTMVSVVVDETTQEVHVFLKGSYEAIKRLSVLTPPDYDEVTAKHSREGCYTLGISHRVLGKLSEVEDQAMSASRDEMEQGNTCLGLMMFRNNLKPDTGDAILAIKAGAIRPVMITGDNALTGMYIAQECGMTSPGSPVLLADVRQPGSEEIFWSNAVTGEEVELPSWLEEEDTELAVTGPAFDVMVRSGLMAKLLLRTRIFARMTPSGKVQCVQMHMAHGITAMCGDGGNDCGALRAAHCGLAMSDAEASIVSPFSTSNKSVFMAVEILKEGRAALATSFSSYKYLLMYGESVICAKMMYAYYSVNLAQWVWILLDSFFVVGLSYSLSLSKPEPTLRPSRPTAKLLGPETLVSTVGVVLVNFLFSIGAILMLIRQPFYQCHEFDARVVDVTKWWLLADNFEGEVLGIMVMYQAITCALIGTFGFEYREVWYKNWVFLVVWSVCFGIITGLLFSKPNSFVCLFRFNCGDPDVLVDLGFFQSASEVNWNIEPYNVPWGHNVLPQKYRGELFALVLCNIFVLIVWQAVVIQGPIRKMCREKAGKKRENQVMSS